MVGKKERDSMQPCVLSSIVQSVGSRPCGTPSRIGTVSNKEDYMLIGITGKKRSGKDTAGFYLCDTYGFRKARPLAIFKDSFKEWFGWDERRLEQEELNGRI